MNYSKALSQVLATVLATVLAATVGGGLDTTGWINVVLAGIGAVSVALVPNLNVGVAKYSKSLITVLTVVLPILAVSLPGGLDSAEVIQLVLAGLGALGVYALPAPLHTANTAEARL
jgi:uncharacterized membrane protein YqaE (UPF0057 family)